MAEQCNLQTIEGEKSNFQYLYKARDKFHICINHSDNAPEYRESLIDEMNEVQNMISRGGRSIKSGEAKKHLDFTGLDTDIAITNESVTADETDLDVTHQLAIENSFLQEQLDAKDYEVSDLQNTLAIMKAQMATIMMQGQQQQPMPPPPPQLLPQQRGQTFPLMQPAGPQHQPIRPMMMPHPRMMPRYPSADGSAPNTPQMLEIPSGVTTPNDLWWDSFSPAPSFEKGYFSGLAEHVEQIREEAGETEAPTLRTPILSDSLTPAPLQKETSPEKIETPVLEMLKTPVIDVPVSTTPAQAAVDSTETGDTPASPGYDDIHFEPIVQVTAATLSTGEEEEVCKFSHRAKLYRFDEESKQWKERGLGDVKLLFHPVKCKARVMMRRDQVLRVCCNHAITVDMDLQKGSADGTWTWATAADFGDDEATPEKFTIRFKTQEIADNFKAAFMNCQKLIVEGVAVPPSFPSTQPESASKEIQENDTSVSAPTNDAKSATSGIRELKLPTVAVGTWSCETCLVSNPPDKIKCLACETLKPGAEAPPATSQQGGTFSFGSGNNQPAAGGFTFGASSGGSGFSFPTASQPSGFSFPSQDSSKPPALSFGTPSTQTATAAFSFAAPAANVDAPAPFLFGSKPAESGTPTPFSFGAQTSAPAPFSFNAPNSQEAAPAQFSFGAQSLAPNALDASSKPEEAPIKDVLDSTEGKTLEDGELEQNDSAASFTFSIGDLVQESPEGKPVFSFASNEKPSETSGSLFSDFSFAKPTGSIDAQPSLNTQTEVKPFAGFNMIGQKSEPQAAPSPFAGFSFGTPTPLSTTESQTAFPLMTSLLQTTPTKSSEAPGPPQVSTSPIAGMTSLPVFASKQVPVTIDPTSFWSAGDPENKPFFTGNQIALSSIAHKEPREVSEEEFFGAQNWQNNEGEGEGEEYAEGEFDYENYFEDENGNYEGYEYDEEYDGYYEDDEDDDDDEFYEEDTGEYKTPSVGSSRKNSTEALDQLGEDRQADDRFEIQRKDIINRNVTVIDDEVVITYETKPSFAQKIKASRLHLAPTFYLYEQRPACKGCRGCIENWQEPVPAQPVAKIIEQVVKVEAAPVSAATPLSSGTSLFSGIQSTGVSFASLAANSQNSLFGPARTDSGFEGVEGRSFTGAGTALFGNQSKSGDGEEEVQQYEPDIEVTPIAQVEKEDLKTGEEDDEVMFSHRGKLFVFSDKQWKERGIGDIKIQRNKLSGYCRVLMRRDIVRKVCLNHAVMPEMDLKFMPGTDKQLSWGTGSDYSDGLPPVPRQLCIKFKYPETANDFKEKFNTCQDLMKPVLEAEQAKANQTKPEEISSEPQVVNSTTKSDKPVESSNTSSMTTTTTATSANDADSRYYEEDQPDIYVKPIAEVTKTKVMSGEENDEVLFSARTKLYRFNKDNKDWRERGLGEIKILKNNKSGVYRVLMRRDQIHKVCANHALVVGMTITQVKENNKQVLWLTPCDMADDEEKPEQFCAKFKTAEIATEFVNTFEDAVCSLSMDATAVPKKSEPKASAAPAKTAMELRLAPKPGSWECTTCLIRNDAEKRKCAACETPNPNASAEDAEEPAKASSSFSFGTTSQPAGAAAAPFSFSFPKKESSVMTSSPFSFTVPKKEGENTDSKAGTDQPSFSFGQTSSSALSSGFSFGSTTTTGSGFSFGASSAASQSKDKEEASTGFTFPSIGKQTSVATTSSVFSFGSSNSGPGFSFGASSASPQVKDKGPEVDRFAADPDTWECPSCMAKNNGDRTHCRTCAAARERTPVVKLDPSKFSEPIKFKEDTSKTAPLSFDDKLKAKFGAKPGSWECNTCLVSNDAASAACVACSTPNPNATAVPAASSASSGTFSFGSGTSSNTGFSFGQSSKGSDSSFKFGNNETPQSGFLFGSQNSDQKGFSFNTVKSETAPSFGGFGSITTSASSNLPFGPTFVSPNVVAGSPSDAELMPAPQFLPPRLQKSSPKQESKPTITKSKDSIFSWMPAGLEKSNLFSFGSDPSPAPSAASSVDDVSKAGLDLDEDLASKSQAPSVFGGSTFNFKFEPTPIDSPTSKPKTPIKSPIKSPVKVQSPDYNEGDSELERSIEFEALVTLDQVEMSSGEEKEEALFCEKSKLFRFDSDSKQWKERGKGDMKILKHKENGHCRILMRRDQIHKLCANHSLLKGMTIQEMQGNNKTYVWKTTADFAEDECKEEMFAARFKDEDIAKSFADAFKEACARPVDKIVTSKASDAFKSSKKSVSISESTHDDDDDDDDLVIIYSSGVEDGLKTKANSLLLPEKFYHVPSVEIGGEKTTDER